MRALAAVRSPLAEAWLLTTSLLRHRALAIRRDWKSRSLYGFALALGVFVFFLIFVGTYAGVRVLEAASADALLRSIPAWAFLVYLFTDILIAFGQALGDLYLSRDMAILLSMPLRVPNIILAKFVLGVVQNEVYAAIFLLPFALGYLGGTGAAWWTYPVAVSAVFVFPATLYAVLVVVTIAALRVIPPKVAKEGLWLVGASVPTVFWFLSFYRVAHLTGDITTMRLPEPPDWLPSTWVGNVLSFAGAGEREAALAWMSLLLTTTFLACPVALVFVARAFDRGWSNAIAAPARRRSASADAQKPRSAVAALAEKDLLTFFRSPALWFNHIAALGFVGYLLVGHSVQTALLPLTPQLAMTQVGFVAVLGALNPGMTALSLEHLAVWILRSAPLSASEILAAKFAVAYVQTGTISGIGAAALAYGYGFPMALAFALVIFAMGASASSVCVGIAFDSAHPSFAWDNPNQINRGLRMIVPFLANIGVLMVSALLLFGLRAVLPEPVAVAAGVVCCLALYVLTARIALQLAHANVAVLEV